MFTEPVTGLTNAYRSSSRWHTRACGQAVIRGVESDVVKRLEAYPAEDVEMELPGTAIPDDEFHEEPHLEEAKVPEEIPNVVRSFEAMDTCHRLRNTRFAGARHSSRTQGIVNGELVYVWRKVKENRTDTRTALVTHRWYGPAIVVGKEKNSVFVSHRGRVTKVAPECLRQASVAEQMSWDITTTEKALFEKALGGEDLSWEEPMLDESGGSLDTEMPDMAAEPPTLEGEDSPPVIDDDDGSPVSEATIDK